MLSDFEKKLLDEEIFDKKQIVKSTEPSIAFRKICEGENLKDRTATEIVDTEKFFENVDKINKKHPFVFLPNLLEDFIDGVYTTKILKTYEIPEAVNLQTIVYQLGFKTPAGGRDKSENAREVNLSLPEWRENYDWLKKYFEQYDDELHRLFFFNLNRAFLLLRINFYKTVIKEDKLVIINENSDANKEYEFFKSCLIELSSRVSPEDEDDYMKFLTGVDEEVLDQLSREQLIKIKNDGVYEAVTFDHYDLDLENQILEIMQPTSKAITYSSLQRKLLNTNPILQIIPISKLWNDALRNLENENKIARKAAFWKFSPQNDQIFSMKTYESMMQEEQKELEKVIQQEIATGKTKFYGRQNKDPNVFVAELEELEKGDFGDEDDQVTRIAGLVLADSPILKTPHENLKEFDFAVDVSNYKMPIDLHSKLVHVKVMLDKIVSERVITELKENLPAGQQGVIISFRPISKNTKKATEDKSIQIVDKDGIITWASMTPVLPARTGAICKIRYGEMAGKIAKITSINFESGLATFNVFPDMDESSGTIGSLEEIEQTTSDPEKHELFMKNYSEILQILYNLSTSPEYFEEAVFNPELENEDPDSNEYSDDRIYWQKRGKRETEIRYASSVRDHPCGCYHLADEENMGTLCKHKIAILNKLCLDNFYFDETWETGNKLKKKLDHSLKNSNEQLLDKIIYSISGDACTVLKECLRKYSDGGGPEYSIESSIYADGQDKILIKNIQNLEKNLKISSPDQIKSLKKMIDEHLESGF